MVDVARVTIDMLPDVALLGIFDLYVGEAGLSWHVLVHVCRTWRNVVFGSPRRLGLKLHCRASTPVREMLDVWPLLPIVINNYFHHGCGVDNIIAALEHKDRICQLKLFDFPSSQFEELLAVMQRPFPVLTHLRIRPRHETPLPLIPVPTSFLGGFAPQLQVLDLNRFSFPGLPNLLLSATHLVTLSLKGITRSGYISPEAMLNCFSVLTRLESLRIVFESAQSFPRRRSRYLPRSTRTLLPILSKVWFEGATDYLEDLVAWIDAPLLDTLDVNFFSQMMFETPQLAQFIDRTPKFKAYDDALLFLSGSDAWVILSPTFDRWLQLKISCSSPSDEQASSLAQICSLSFPRALISSVEHLYILSTSDWQPEDDIGNDQWLELLHPFTGAKALYLPLEFMLCVPLALQELVGERVTEVLPALQTFLLEDMVPPPGVHDAIGQIVAARWLANRLISISLWNGEDGTGPEMGQGNMEWEERRWRQWDGDGDGGAEITY